MPFWEKPGMMESSNANIEITSYLRRCVHFVVLSKLWNMVKEIIFSPQMNANERKE